MKLKKGKNAILLKVANGNNPHGFYFSLTSGGRSEGSAEEVGHEHSQFEGECYTMYKNDPPTDSLAP